MKASVSLSPEAERRVSDLLAGHPDGSGLRLATKSSGCAGLGYEMSIEESAGPRDEVIVQGDARIFVPAASLLHLLGTRIVLEKDALSERFVFENPNVSDSCGCGESFCVG